MDTILNFFKSVFFFIMDILGTIAFVGSIFIVIYLFVMQPNRVEGASMDPTFASGDYIFTSKITYRLRPYHRGDVVVFRSPRNPDIEYIKRIIGLPNDRIRIHDGEVYVNDTRLNEPYIADKTNLWEGWYVKDNEELVVPAEMIFVMGDNRPRSSDSRDFGPIPFDSVIGQVFFRYFPASTAGTIPNPLPEKLQTFLFSEALRIGGYLG